MMSRSAIKSDGNACMALWASHAMGRSSLLPCSAAQRTVAPKRASACLRRPTPTKSVVVLQGGLSPPSALGSSLLLPRPWAALLRLLLQQKVPAQTLKKLAGPVILDEEEGLEEVIWACLPKITHDIWQQTPHRMYSAEAEVRC